MSVLRWWFSLNYDSVTATSDRQAFAVRGQGVKVESENERLAAEGQRIHTGQSDELNLKFAHSFTEHFDALAAKYPIYAELRNLCDLALVASLIREENLADRTNWHMTCFGDPKAFAVELGVTPKTVETVANVRVVNLKTKITLLAGVSGGVRVDPRGLVSRGAVRIDGGPSLAAQRTAAQRQNLPSSAWWWD